MNECVCVKYINVIIVTLIMLLYLFGIVALKTRKKNPKLHSKAAKFYQRLKGRTFKNYSRKSGAAKEGYTPGILDSFKYEWIENESAFTVEDAAEKIIDEFFEENKDVILHVRKFKIKD